MTAKKSATRKITAEPARPAGASAGAAVLRRIGRVMVAIQPSPVEPRRLTRQQIDEAVDAVLAGRA